MYHFFTASKDSSIYLQQPRQNTGLDEILEISKIYYGTIKDISRTLIQFDISDISQSIFDGDITMSYAELLLKEAESRTSGEIPINFEIYAYPLSQSWDMGIGTRFDEITAEGVSWDARKTDVDWLEYNYTTGTTGSFDGSGGVWYTGSAASTSYEYTTNDINMNVTDMINSWVSGTIDNNGMILKYPDSLELDTNDYGQLKFFSKETNTIYQPKLRIGWDDSSFVTGSLTELTNDDISISFKRLKSRYGVNSKPKIRVIGRELYPLKTFTNLYGYNDIKFLPETTYYQIKDALTDEIIIPFSNYSKVSCDSDGNYIRLNFRNWEVERNYYIEIKVVRDGVVEYFSNIKQPFRVVV